MKTGNRVTQLEVTMLYGEINLTATPTSVGVSFFVNFPN
jgi:hypothetical protein